MHRSKNVHINRIFHKFISCLYIWICLDLLIEYFIYFMQWQWLFDGCSSASLHRVIPIGIGSECIIYECVLYIHWIYTRTSYILLLILLLNENVPYKVNLSICSTSIFLLSFIHVYCRKRLLVNILLLYIICGRNGEMTILVSPSTRTLLSSISIPLVLLYIFCQSWCRMQKVHIAHSCNTRSRICSMQVVECHATWINWMCTISVSWFTNAAWHRRPTEHDCGVFHVPVMLASAILVEVWISQRILPSNFARSTMLAWLLWIKPVMRIPNVLLAATYFFRYWNEYPEKTCIHISLSFDCVRSIEWFFVLFMHLHFSYIWIMYI